MAEVGSSEPSVNPAEGDVPAEEHDEPPDATDDDEDDDEEDEEPISEQREDFVETSKDGRFGRYDEVLGQGASKTVYKGFDEVKGIEVAWNKACLAKGKEVEEYERLRKEVVLLQKLNHKNIINIYKYWVDESRSELNFITEIFTHGTIRQYSQVHKHISLHVLKNWSVQILHGLVYLHSCDPPIIHRDLKSDNVFINGGTGEVKIADLGASTMLDTRARGCQTVVGTRTHMAPEMYEKDYDEKVDIYAFGMCMLEVATRSIPYVECTTQGQLMRKVLRFDPPAALEQVKNEELRRFISVCIQPTPDLRPTASELLSHPFLMPVPVEKKLKPNKPMELFLMVPTLGMTKQVRCTFNPKSDTPESVARELALEFKLSSIEELEVSQDIRNRLVQKSLNAATPTSTIAPDGSGHPHKAESGPSQLEDTAPADSAHCVDESEKRSPAAAGGVAVDIADTPMTQATETKSAETTFETESLTLPEPDGSTDPEKVGYSPQQRRVELASTEPVHGGLKIQVPEELQEHVEQLESDKDGEEERRLFVRKDSYSRLDVSLTTTNTIKKGKDAPPVPLRDFVQRLSGSKSLETEKEQRTCLPSSSERGALVSEYSDADECGNVFPASHVLEDTISSRETIPAMPEFDGQLDNPIAYSGSDSQLSAGGAAPLPFHEEPLLSSSPPMVGKLKRQHSFDSARPPPETSAPGQSVKGFQPVFKAKSVDETGQIDVEQNHEPARTPGKELSLHLELSPSAESSPVCNQPILQPRTPEPADQPAAAPSYVSCSSCDEHVDADSLEEEDNEEEDENEMAEFEAQLQREREKLEREQNEKRKQKQLEQNLKKQNRQGKAGGPRPRLTLEGVATVQLAIESLGLGDRSSRPEAPVTPKLTNGNIFKMATSETGTLANGEVLVAEAVESPKERASVSSPAALLESPKVPNGLSRVVDSLQYPQGPTVASEHWKVVREKVGASAHTHLEGDCSLQSSCEKQKLSARMQQLEAAALNQLHRGLPGSQKDVKPLEKSIDAVKVAANGHGLMKTGTATNGPNAFAGNVQGAAKLYQPPSSTLSQLAQLEAKCLGAFDNGSLCSTPNSKNGMVLMMQQGLSSNGFSSVQGLKGSSGPAANGNMLKGPSCGIFPPSTVAQHLVSSGVSNGGLPKPMLFSEADERRGPRSPFGVGLMPNSGGN